MGVPGSVSPDRAVQLLDDALTKSTPVQQWQYVSVTFNANANGDTDIPHRLKVTDPYAVDFQVLNLKLTAAPGTVPVVYRNMAGTARPWQNNFLVLRSNVASLQCDLLLTVRRTQALSIF